MMRRYGWVCLLLSGLASGSAMAQTPATSPPAPSAPRPAHTPDPPAADGTKANPADAASPVLADPLKQQAVTDPPPSLATPAVQFITQASMDSLTEIQMADAALKRSSNSKVRQFARRMLADHRSLNTQLQALAQKEGTSVAGVLDSDHAVAVQRLGALSDSAFDAAYATQMLSAHDRAIELYRAASSLSDANVALYASGALPMLRVHRSQAQALAAHASPHA